VGPGGAECAAQADLGAALDDRDDHHVGDADATDEQRDRAETQEQGGERTARGFLSRERIRRSRDLHLLRCGGVDGCAEHAAYGIDGVVLGTHVDRLRGDGLAEDVGLGRSDTDDGGAVQPLGGGDVIEDADHCEPLVADVHAQAVGDVDHPQLLGSGDAEHDGRIRARGGVEPGAIDELRVQRVEQTLVGGEHRDAARDALADGVGAADGRVDGGQGTDRGDGADAADHADGGGGQLARAAPEAGAGLHLQQVRTQCPDLRVEVLLRRRGQSQHPDHGSDADGDSERRQAGAQPAGAQAQRAHAQHVADAQLGA